MSIDLDAIERRYVEQHSVKCPNCSHEYQDDTEFLSNNELITYHGSEDGAIKVDCYNCDESFYIKEIVDRTFEVGKKIDSRHDIIEE